MGFKYHWRESVKTCGYFSANAHRAFTLEAYGCPPIELLNYEVQTWRLNIYDTEPMRLALSETYHQMRNNIRRQIGYFVIDRSSR